MEEFDKIYLIACRTGCSCCAGENHYRGPYRTREDAERRIKYYYNPDGQYCPLASQYAKRGRYMIEEVKVEPISSGRFILDETYVVPSLDFVEVHEDGSVNFNEAERFDGMEY